MMTDIRLHSITVSVYRAPIDTPVQTSFGVLRDRAAVLVQVLDEDGVTGLGEIWCNFPTVGAEHRARLLSETVAPLALARSWPSVQECHQTLTRTLHVLAVQAGERGPIAHVLAGLDIALWDLAAQRERMPLWRMLGGKTGNVQVYASGLNPTEPERLAAAKAAEGHTRFKLKVGFGADRDLSNLANLRSTLGASSALMVDANQAWDVDEAAAMSRRLSQCSPLWLEEPIGADRPLQDWRRLAALSPIPLVAGENLYGEEFASYLGAGVLKAIQPDVAKWGGFSGCLPLGKAAADAATWLCPHWLGGGAGLLAALHLKAAIGGEGFAEVDSNPNPLRELLAGELPPVREGAVKLPDLPGLGATPDFSSLHRYLVAQTTIPQGQP